jgi:hypothetical protein
MLTWCVVVDLPMKKCLIVSKCLQTIAVELEEELKSSEHGLSYFLFASTYRRSQEALEIAGSEVDICTRRRREWQAASDFVDADSVSASHRAEEKREAPHSSNLADRIKVYSIFLLSFLSLIARRTKHTERYYTPEVKSKVQERDQYRELLEAESHKAFLDFLGEVAQNHYGVMREAADKLAIADCLFSLTQVSLQGNYVRPQFTDEDILEIEEGRHPMVEVLSSDPFVPVSVKIGGGEPRSKIITGPNMGGKSCCVRMIALIAIMAQIGSYVPAVSVKIGMQDAVLTRMGGECEDIFENCLHW